MAKVPLWKFPDISRLRAVSVSEAFIPGLEIVLRTVLNITMKIV